MIQCVRGEIREFVSSVGFETSIEELLDRIQEQFGEHWTADHLKQEFYQLTKGKTEKVWQFAGRLEAKFKQLREKIPWTYEKSIRISEILSSSATRRLRQPMINS